MTFSSCTAKDKQQTPAPAQEAPKQQTPPLAAEETVPDGFNNLTFYWKGNADPASTDGTIVVNTPQAGGTADPSASATAAASYYTEPTSSMKNNAKKGYVSGDKVNMRKGPGTEYGLADSGLKSGMDVTVYLKQGDWYFLRVNKTGKYGYIYKDYVVLEDDEPDATPTKKPTEEPAIRLSQGDVNGDGLVSAADAAMVLRYDAGLIDLSDPKLAAADMDGDGQVTSLDAKAILKYVAGRLAR